MYVAPDIQEDVDVQVSTWNVEIQHKTNNTTRIPTERVGRRRKGNQTSGQGAEDRVFWVGNRNEFEKPTINQKSLFWL